MLKSIINRFKTTRPFKDFYKEWITTLKTTLLPPLTQSLYSPSSDLLATHIQLIHAHFNSYFAALDAASNDDVSQLLFPSFRNSLEKPFIWLGDFHPYIFTNLLRSFLEYDDSDECEDGSVLDSLNRPWNAWRNLDGSLGHKIEQIECGLRLMVPAIAGRVKSAQGGLVERLAKEWRKDGCDLEVGGVVGELMDEMTCVFLDANRLRRSVLGDIIGALNVYQAAFFLEGLAKFYVGFWDAKLLAQLKNSGLTLD